MTDEPRHRQVQLPDSSEVEQRLRDFGGGIPGLTPFYQAIGQQIGGLTQKPHDLVLAFSVAVRDANKRGELDPLSFVALKRVLVPRLFATLTDDQVFIQQAQADWNDTQLS